MRILLVSPPASSRKRTSRGSFPTIQAEISRGSFREWCQTVSSRSSTKWVSRGQETPDRSTLRRNQKDTLGRVREHQSEEYGYEQMARDDPFPDPLEVQRTGNPGTGDGLARFLERPLDQEDLELAPSALLQVSPLARKVDGVRQVTVQAIVVSFSTADTRS